MSEPVSRQWWVAGRSSAEGPFSTAEITSQIQSGERSPTTLLCPVGNSEWQPLCTWSEFATLVPPPPPSSSIRRTDSVLTNPKLPPIANWICVYCILVVPALFVCDLVSELSQPQAAAPVQQAAQPASLLPMLEVILMGRAIGLGVVLVLGGLQLRNLNPSAPTILKTGLWLDVVTGFLLILVLLLVIAFVAGTAAMDPDVAADQDVPWSTFDSALLVLHTFTFVFEVGALVWLHRYGAELRTAFG